MRGRVFTRMANASTVVRGAPPGWRQGFIGKTIRYRWSPDVAWRYGLVLPDRDAEDSCGECCIRVASFGDFGEPIGSRGLRFAYPCTGWMAGAQVEVVEPPRE